MEINDKVFDDRIRISLQRSDHSMPREFAHPDVIWTRLQKRTLENRTARKKIILSVAASLLILMISVFVILKPATHQNNMTLIEEYTTQEHEQKAIEYIRTLCRENHNVCASPVFTELQNDLEASALQLNEIDKKIFLFGNDEELLRAKMRIENHQARLIKEMIQTL